MLYYDTPNVIGHRVKADYSCSFDLLPHVPLYPSFWAADEEFDADCKLLFDRSAEDHIISNTSPISSRNSQKNLQRERHNPRGTNKLVPPLLFSPAHDGKLLTVLETSPSFSYMRSTPYNFRAIPRNRYLTNFERNVRSYFFLRLK